MRAVDKPQSVAHRNNRVRSYRRWCIIDTAHLQRRLVDSKKRDHVILVHAVTGHTDSTHQCSAPVYRHTAWKNLRAVGQCHDGIRDCKAVTDTTDTRAISADIGQDRA